MRPHERDLNDHACVTRLGRRLALLLLLAAPLAARAAAPQVRTDPERLVNGSAFVVRVTPPPGTEWQAVEATLDGRAIAFAPAADGTWSGIGGVDFDAAPGAHELSLVAFGRGGTGETFAIPLAVAHEERPTSRLTVPKRFIAPDAKTRARIERERELKARLLAASAADRLFAGRFAPPLASRTSEGYGIERVFNGTRQSVHYGLDYRASKGTPVAAMNAGRVLLARDLFYEGRCVAVDHGQGLVTLYLHFSRLDVKEGNRIARGQRLGLSGASGRVTGPHLHVAVRWRGLYLDPASLLALPAP
jgi:murein DD-endopeptidase MepM/ murein hydrolase activator NlpD